MLKHMARQRTWMAKPKEVEDRWWLVDAKGKVLGRLASQIARILMGKHKPEYTPHVDTGDHVVVINADKVVLTGKKWKDKIYYWHTGWPGGLRQMTAEEMLKRHPERLIYLAVKRMLPKNKLARKLLKKLKVYAGDSHPHQAQKPQPLDLPG